VAEDVAVAVDGAEEELMCRVCVGVYVRGLCECRVDVSLIVGLTIRGEANDDARSTGGRGGDSEDTTVVFW
jgi:hypothetical protein